MQKLGINHHSAFIMQMLALCFGALLSVQAQATLFGTVKHPMAAEQAFAVSMEQNNDQIDLVWNIIYTKTSLSSPHLMASL